MLAAPFRMGGTMLMNSAAPLAPLRWSKGPASGALKLLHHHPFRGGGVERGRKFAESEVEQKTALGNSRCQPLTSTPVA